nr:MAG TPA: hypothetical protein [Caudoviricetes sp.]
MINILILLYSVNTEYSIFIYTQNVNLRLTYKYVCDILRPAKRKRE